MRHLHLELVRVTEGAAIAASDHIGRGDKIAADKAASDTMRTQLGKIWFKGKIVVGEGEKDNAPGLFRGEQVGLWAWDSRTGMIMDQCVREGKEYPDWIKRDISQQDYDLAVDPLDGTTATSKGANEAMSVIAVGKRGCLLETDDWYMQKLAVGPQVAHKVKLDMNAPLDVTINHISKALNKDANRLVICLLDRPRHAAVIDQLRQLGCRIKLIQDCDVSAAIATAIPDSGIDAYMGVGGASEGVIGAAALKCMGGEFQGVLCDKEGKPKDGFLYRTEDLAKGDVIFCATGVTDGSLLKGVRWTSQGPTTHSLLMRSESGTVRWISAIHGN